MQKLVFLTVLCLYGITAQDCEDRREEECSTTAPTTIIPFNQYEDWESAGSMYDFHATDIHGNEVQMDRYRGHVCIVVNVASKCGFTDTHYKELVKLYERYNETEGLRILAFPSNQFAEQEPGNSTEILNFVKKYNVNFDLFQKIDVNGEKAHPLWKWLRAQAGGFITDSIKWNFTKFIVDKDGQVVARHAPTTRPFEMEPELRTYF